MTFASPPRPKQTKLQAENARLREELTALQTRLAAVVAVPAPASAEVLDDEQTAAQRYDLDGIIAETFEWSPPTERLYAAFKHRLVKELRLRERRDSLRRIGG